ncbi:MAG: tail fiber domain-containing protein, partial [Chitinophagia bacterium]|nr:tail fiber domain-containing protein [Chitinophagia bacterium]
LTYGNLAVGTSAINGAQSGTGGNVAIGPIALRDNTTGYENTVVGRAAMQINTGGYRNTAIGRWAGYSTSGGTTTNANTTGSNNTFLGAFAMPGTSTQLTYATALGSDALVTTSSTIALGRTSDKVVIGATGDDSSGAMLQVTGAIKATGTVTGTSFVATSDVRLKQDIDAINRDVLLDNLKRINAYSYHFKADPNGWRYNGVLAQELQQVFPDSVRLGSNGFYSVDYGSLGALAASGVGQLANKFDAFSSKFSFAADGSSLTINASKLNIAEIDANTIMAKRVTSDSITAKNIDITNAVIDALNVKSKLTANKAELQTLDAQAIAAKSITSDKLTVQEVTANNLSAQTIVSNQLFISADSRSKENIAQYNRDGLLNSLKSINVYSSNAINDPLKKRSAGLIAQEVQALFPELVNIDKNGAAGVDYSAISAIAAVAVGQLSNKVDALQANFTVKDAGGTL